MVPIFNFVPHDYVLLGYPCILRIIVLKSLATLQAVK